MKTIYTLLISLSTIACISSCTDKYTEELILNSPVYMNYETLRSSVRTIPARNLVFPGKIYFKGNYLMIVERSSGVHIIDVSNPSNPQNRVFIEIPGCVDIAMKGNFMYADSYVDLVTIDLSDITNPKETGRLKDVFTYSLPPAENGELPYANIDKEKGVVIGWEIKQIKRDMELIRNYPNYPIYYSYEDYYGPNKGLTDSGYRDVTSGSAASSSGKSGSMARIGLYGNYLYAAADYNLTVFNVENASKPEKSGSIGVGTVETMFIYDNHIFFGMPNGMSVYSLNAPSAPAYVSAFWHTTSCDPVVIQGEYAYITLRGGSDCNNSTVNRLDIVKVSNNYKSYELTGSFNMTEPYGLGIDGNTLFLCDGKAGLKIYDVTDKKNVTDHLLASFPDIQVYDVIPVENYLFASGKNGFYLYDYSDLKNIRQIGHIPVFMPD